MKKQSNNQSTDYTDYTDYFRKSAICRSTPLTALSLSKGNPQSAINKTGFTLMEVMMSLGILVVGLAMIATAFPTAMMETKHSVADTSATMVSENAAAICRVRLSHDTIKGTVTGQLQDISFLGAPTAWLPDAERAYPIARPIGDYPDDWVDVAGTDYPSSRYGWLVAARQIDDVNDINDYQLVIVPYRKFLPEHAPPTFSPVSTDGNAITFGNVSIGSPVISTTDGTFAYVLDSGGNLSVTITSGAAMAVGADKTNSPAIGCYVVRTAVAP